MFPRQVKKRETAWYSKKEINENLKEVQRLAAEYKVVQHADSLKDSCELILRCIDASSKRGSVSSSPASKCTEVLDYHRLQRSRTTTYGTCIACMNSGPVCNVCMECYNNGFKTAGFLIVKKEQKILDSITIMEIFGQNQQKAKAD
jgi:hypothetical protein